MKRLLPIVAAALLISSSALAQTTAPAPDSTIVIDFNVTACHTEYIGPMQIRSGNWALVDSIIATLGNDKALAYFKEHLHDNRSAAFYALIGIHKTGGAGEFEAAMLSIENEEILFQKGCLMMKKPIREAVDIALRDRN